METKPFRSIFVTFDKISPFYSMFEAPSQIEYLPSVFLTVSYCSHLLSYIPTVADCLGKVLGYCLLIIRACFVPLFHWQRCKVPLLAQSYGEWVLFLYIAHGHWRCECDIHYCMSINVDTGSFAVWAMLQMSTEVIWYQRKDGINNILKMAPYSN